MPTARVQAGGTGVDFAYDALGRPLSSTASGRSLSYQYDAAGNRTRLTFPDTGANALYVSYGYDVLNRVTSIGENGATSGVGLLASYGYDSLGRRQTVTRAGGTGASTSYGYDGASRLRNLIQSLAGTAAATYTFGYNAAGQTLTRSLTNDTYTAHPAATTAGYVANGLNQYASVSGTAFTHDARGDLTSDGTRAFTYSLDNQLLTGSAPTATTLAYDPLGRLQTQTTGGATTTFLYDGSDLVGEYDGSGNILRRYVPGPGVDEPVVWYEGAGTATRRWLAADQQGSIIAWSDQNGVAGASYAYGVYGEPLTPAGASAWGGSRFRYTGQIEIPEAQIYHDKARAYDPGLGRFVQVDPAGYADNLIAYAYVGDDPVNGRDPSGLQAVIDRTTIHYNAGPEGLAPPEELVVTSTGKDFGTQGASTLATPGGASEEHEAPQNNKTNVIPKNALICTSGGVTFYAPQSFNPNEIQNAGAAEGPVNGLLDAGRAVGYRGAYDFQRVTNASGGFTFVSAYTNASNFAVGLYLTGAGYGNSLVGAAISNGYSVGNAGHFSSADAAAYRNAGIVSANGAGVTCRPAF